MKIESNKARCFEADASISAMYDFSVLRELRKRQEMTIADVSESSGVSAAVISRLERNQAQAELATLYRLSRVFGMTVTDLVSLAESRSAHRVGASSYESGGMRFSRIVYGNARCMYGRGAKGMRLSRPEVHQDDYEICWVLQGRLLLTLPNEKYELGVGDAVQFDAILEHTYEVLEDCTLMIIHIGKAKRF
jgi:transcriptional regulator with XRE-family HTH domain